MNMLLRGFDRTMEFCACVLVVLLLLAVAAGVVTRGLDDPLAWTDEAARMLMVWLAAFGWILSTRSHLHVRIRYFQDRLPPSARRAAEAMIQLGMFALGVLVAWHGVQLVTRNIDLEATSLPISMAWMYVPMVPAGIVTAAQALGDIAAQFTGRPVATPASQTVPVE